MKKRTLRNFLAAPAVVIIFFTSLAVGAWQIQDNVFLLITFLYIGIFTAGGMLLYALLPKKKKHFGRRLSFFMIGILLLLVGLGILGRENLQIEGFFFYILAGFYVGTVTHYLISKILGPVLLQRTWCGWGCWTMMVLDLLPYKKSSGRLAGNWGRLRYAHFAISLVVVLILWYGLDYTIHKQQWDIAGLYWLAAGNAFYYAAGIGLAYKLKDNRAFCKYVCPITVFLKISSIFSVLRIKGSSEACNECGACVKMCPMDIQIPGYIKSGRRVLSTECIMCLTCIDTCPSGVLRASVGFDLGGREPPKERKT